jgi:hypothetical protein
MMIASYDVQRICIRARPKSTNPDYFEWQPALIVVLVPEKDKLIAIDRARAEIDRRRWDFISYVSKSTLIEDRVREAGAEVWEAFQKAKSGLLVFEVFPDHFGAGNKSIRKLLPARITEAFIDKVIRLAGGRRLTTDEIQSGIENTDYILGDVVFELKDIEEEGLEKAERQAKIAKLFSSYFPGKREIRIDPSILSKDDHMLYLDILAGPIKTHIKKAARQVKATKNLLGRPGLKGGIILLNTGFGSYPHEYFADQVERFAHKDSTVFVAVVSISVWSITNGFDTFAFYKFSPEHPERTEVEAIRDAFSGCFTDMMTQVLQGGLSKDTPMSAPSKPVAFTCDGIDFAWEPAKVLLPGHINGIEPGD